MNSFEVVFENGDVIFTDMNATLEEAQAYYVGHRFQFGDTQSCKRDKMVKAVAVNMLTK